MLASFFDTIKSFSSTNPPKPRTGDKRSRNSGVDCDDDDDDVIITDVLQTPPSKRLKDTESGSSKPISNFKTLVRGIHSWSDKYIWRHVVGSNVPLSDAEILSEEEMEKYDILTSEAKLYQSATNERKCDWSVRMPSGLTRQPIASRGSSYRPETQSKLRQPSATAHTTKDFEETEEPPWWIQNDLGGSYLHADYFPEKYRTEKRCSEPDSMNARPLQYVQDKYRSRTQNQHSPTWHSDLQSKKCINSSMTSNSSQPRKPKLNFTIGQSLQDSGSMQGKSISRHSRGYDNHKNRSRPRVVSTVDEVVRLEERNRYRQVLSQFTTAVLPPVGSLDMSWSASRSTSLFDTETHDQQKELQHAGVADGSFLSNSSLYSKPPTVVKPVLKPPTVHRMIASPTKMQCRTSANVFLYSKPEQCGTSRKDSSLKTSQSKLVDPSSSDTLGNDWTRKWREIVSEESLSRAREISKEERKLEAIRAKEREEQEALAKEIRERMKEQEKESKEEEPFVALTDDMERKVDAALDPGYPEDPLANGFRMTIRRSDVATLSNLNWLNDEIMNCYFTLIMERSKEPGRCKVHAFNSFFYPKLVKSGHATLRRWTKKVDIFSMDIVAVPIHLGMHWCLAIIDLRKKCISYYDSLKGSNPQCLSALKNYLSDESMDKKKQPFDFSGWTTSSPRDIPEQLNGCDCGVFTCKYAEYITRDAPFDFDQRHMPYFRRRMVYEILAMQLL